MTGQEHNTLRYLGRGRASIGIRLLLNSNAFKEAFAINKEIQVINKSIEENQKTFSGKNIIVPRKNKTNRK